MTRLSPFVQKIVYICLIVALLIPLSFIARPATQRGEEGKRDTGGQLAQLRNHYNLSQAKLGEIDPASETMKLMSLGFRSVAATSLWLNAIDAQTVKDWDRFASSLNTLIKIQPNLHKVWEYQAHNLAYNTSVEFDDYEQRYSWVKKGMDLLRKGLTYNQRDHRFTDWLGKYTGQKLGRSDEKVEFRQLFRHDDDYHASLDDVFDRDSYDAGQYGKDNWLLAYQWFNLSETMVEQGVRGEKATLQTKPIMFYMNRPAQRRNHVISLQSEYPPEESFKFKWQLAHDEWEDYGNREMRTALNIPITLNGMVKTENDLKKLRADLDRYAPGVRSRIMAEIEPELDFSDEVKRLLTLDIETLNEYEKLKVRQAQSKIEESSQAIDERVLAAVAPADREEAETVYLKLKEAYLRIRKIDLERKTINYPFWQQRTTVEMSDEALDAHQAFYDAHRKNRDGIYDDFVAYNPEFHRPTIDGSATPPVEPGAIREFIDGFQFWANAANVYPDLSSSALFDIMLEDAKLVREMVDALGQPWPKNFPFQRYIDENPGPAAQYHLPTSAELQQFEEESGLPPRPSLDLEAPAPDTR